MSKGSNTDAVRENKSLSFEEFKQEVLSDYQLACESREASLLGRKEVLTGKAKFGIFGDGKEVAQIALAKTMKPGDFRSGYYRDQTLVFANGTATIRQFFSQLYADPNLEHDPFSGGRQMNAHFATRSLNEAGEWNDLTKIYNSSSDTSPTASQMARAVGLALASRKYREVSDIPESDKFSNNGNEVVYCTIGDASTSEGIFWEAVNAAGVLKIPLAISVWDDGYGISVPKKYQTTKGSISEVLSGFRTNEEGEGIDIYVVNGWDYPALVETYEKGIAKMRETHRPALFHITEVTQPQGHSTSGSHERYKDETQLTWETEHDCIAKMRNWLLESALATEEELATIETAAKKHARTEQKEAWKLFIEPIKALVNQLVAIGNQLAGESDHQEDIQSLLAALKTKPDPLRRDIFSTIRKLLRMTRFETSEGRNNLLAFRDNLTEENNDHFNAHLYSESSKSALKVPVVEAIYGEDAPVKNGFEILNTCFDNIFASDRRVFAFGEDLGKIGDVNQGFAGLQEIHGEERIFDTGIRELTIMGQGIGMAMRGLRPIAEIQYVDYLIYGLQPLMDDLATLQYRTRGGQKAPMIIRTRGHRLEGIWHTGSPMGMMLNTLRGVHVLVPRNMTQAAGFYNTMLQSDEPAIIVECLNGYRLKEKLPDNVSEFTVPLGVPEILQNGTDVTLVTYGSCVRIAQEAMKMLDEVGISVELVDVQTLLPFDINGVIAESIARTNKVLFLDEDVPGGASAYMMQQVLEGQKAYYHLDVEPRTVSAKAHRAAYGSDGDYFSKPSADDVFEAIYTLMHDSDPAAYPMFF